MLFAVFLGRSPKEEPTLQRLFKPHVLKLSIFLWAARRRCVTGADLRKYAATVGCAACSDIADNGKTAKPHTDECRARIGEHMARDPEGHARCGRDVEREVQEALVPLVKEKCG